MEIGYIFYGIASNCWNAAGLSPEDQRHQICKLGFHSNKRLSWKILNCTGPVASRYFGREEHNHLYILY